ncbi:unnamed protein product [Rotaria socialis]|uniref:eRF1 domain-containing protein n=1 Tax=Rotaria socialis TaxID=392032 RepID=A0A820SYA7_9BILA|nr:unnamed protein product [Rotaria socialis]
MAEYQDIQQELYADDPRFAFIVMGTNEALFGILHSNNREIIARFSVDLPRKRSCSGTRAIRFARLRKEKRQNYVRKVFEIAVQRFIIDDKVNVDGIILANAAEFNAELYHLNDITDPRIPENILQRVTVCHDGDIGFNQAIELAMQFFNEVSKDSKQYCFGLEDTLKQLETGDLEILIIWKNFDLMRCSMRNNKTKEIKIIYLHPDQDKYTDSEFEQVEQMRLVDWFANNYQKLDVKLEIVTDTSQEGSQFVQGFTGIGGILKRKFDQQLSNIQNISEHLDNNDDDYGSFFD